MPILVRTVDFYTCKFKCGTPAKNEWKMKDHEEKCFCNPENKACKLIVKLIERTINEKV